MQRATFGKRNHPQPASAKSDTTQSLPIALVALAGAAVIGVAVVGAATVFSPPAQEAASAEKLWVTSQRLARHTCPSSTCGVVGELFYREAAIPLETHDGWVRISEPYHADCTNGRSDYVDTGNDQCNQNNGIADGNFAEWVEAAHLSPDRPADPAEGAAGLARSVGQSGDFNFYQAQFVTGAQRLIEAGACTEAQIEDHGGFIASMNLKPRKAYFVHCGIEKYYLDVATMEIFR